MLNIRFMNNNKRMTRCDYTIEEYDPQVHFKFQSYTKKRHFFCSTKQVLIFFTTMYYNNTNVLINKAKYRYICII